MMRHNRGGANVSHTEAILLLFFSIDIEPKVE